MEINYNIHETDNRGGNSFMYACGSGHLNIVKYLVEMNYNIFEKDNTGWNGFMYALSGKKYDIGIYLLEHGYEITDEESIKTIKSRHGKLCQKIEHRMKEIELFYDAIEQSLNEIDIRVVHEIKTFTYDLKNLKDCFLKLQ